MQKTFSMEIILSLFLTLILASGCRQFSTSSSSASGTSSQNSSKCGSTAALTWVAPTTNTDGSALTDLAGFNVYYGNSADNLNNEINIPDAQSTAYTLNNLTVGNYYFAMTAYNASAVESAQSAQVTLTLTDCTKASLNLSTGLVSKQ